MEPRLRKYLNIAALVLLGSAAGLTVGQRWVGASPAGDPDAVAFSGYLEESGQPVTGKRDIGLQFFEDAAGASAICPESVSSTDVADGYFSVTASSACVDGLRRQRSAWYRLSVGGTKLPLTRVPTSVFALRSDESHGGSRLRPRVLIGSDGSRSDVSGWFDTKLGKNCASNAPFANANLFYCLPDGVSLAYVGSAPLAQGFGSVWWQSTLDDKIEEVVGSGYCANGCSYHFTANCTDANKLPGTLKAFWSTWSDPEVHYLADQDTKKLHTATKAFESAPITTLAVLGGAVCSLVVGPGTSGVLLRAYTKGPEVTPDWVTFQEQTL